MAICFKTIVADELVRRLPEIPIIFRCAIGLILYELNSIKSHLACPCYLS
jgi:hypothetical protein